MECPACQQALRTMDYEGITVDTCDGCGGEWLDSGELRQIVRVREARFDAEQRRAVAEASKIRGIKLEDVDEHRDCPKCTRPMSPVNYGGDSGIIISRCSECEGVWLDQGELEKIQMVAESWVDNLPDELAKHGAKLRRIAVETDTGDNVRVSRFGFVNAIINGIVDIFEK